jgi:hypothetical protein
MFKILQFCKVIWVLYAFFSVAHLIFSIIIGFVWPDHAILVHTGGPQFYIPNFFYRLASVTFYYLFTVFVEKWCVKNDIK